MPTLWKTIRVFISSTFRDMHAERDWLVRFVFPKLREDLLKYHIHLADVDLRWGVTSEQDAVGVCREVIDECRPRLVCVLGGRYGWVPAGQHKSITADEIHYGVLDRDAENRGHAFFYFRDDKATARMAEETSGEFREPKGSESARKLAALKKAITDAGLNPRIYGQDAQWDRMQKRLIGLEAFGKKVHDDLLESLKRDPELAARFSSDGTAPSDEFAEEADQMDAFIEDRREGYILGSRGPLMNDLLAFTAAEGTPNVLVLIGEPGSGKSALLAEFARGLAIAHPSWFILPHFIGASIGSTDLRRSLRRLCHELGGAVGNTGQLPLDIKELIAHFHKLLAQAASSRRVIFIFDALNQFDATDGAHWLNWLSCELPPEVRVVASVIASQKGQPEHQTLTVLRNRAGARITMLLPLTEGDTLAIMQAYLKRYSKRFSEGQIAALKAKPASRLPLYILTVLEELRTLGTYEEITDCIRSLPGDSPSLFRWILTERLARDPGFRDLRGRPCGAALVEKFAACLAVSRHGLSPAELAALLDPRDPSGNVAALLRLVRPYLMRRGELLDFYHGQFREAAVAAYLDTPEKQRATHESVATCLQAFADPHRDGRCREASPHALSELPHHQIRAEAWLGVIATLENLLFLEAKVTHGMTFDLAEDFTVAVEALPTEDVERRRLRLVGEALRRDLHFIARHAKDYPQALFQCLWNSAWWYDCSEAAEHYFQFRRGTEAHLHQLMEQWRQLRESTYPGFLWLRSVRPPRVQLGTPLLRVIAGHEGKVASVAFSATGDRIVSGAWDHTVRVWNARDGQELACLRGHKGPVSSVSFALGGSRIISGSWDETVRIWDVSSGRELACLAGHEDAIRAVSVSSDDKMIVSAGGTPTKFGDGVNDYSIRVWDASSGRALNRIRGHKNVVENVAFSPKGNLVVSASWDETIRIWDVSDGKELACLRGHKSEVRTVSFSPDASRIVSGSDNGTASVWDAASGKEILQVWVGPEPVKSVAFSPDGRLLAAGSKDTTVRVWDALTSQPVACLQGHGGAVCSVAFSPDGGRIISASDDSTIRIWESSSSGEAERLRGHDKTIYDVCFSPTGDRVASGSKDGTIRVWDACTGRELARLDSGDGSPFWKLWFSPEGTRIVARASDPKADDGWEEVWVWDVDTRKKLARISPYARSRWGRPRDYLTLLFFSPDGSRIASAADRNTVQVWDLNTGGEFPPMTGHRRRVRCVAFSPTGDLLVSGSDDKTLRLWDVETGQEVASLSGHERIVSRVSFSKDGRRIVSGSDDKTIRVWDVGAGREVMCLRGHERTVSCLAFSPAGDRIVSALDDNTLRVWDLATGKQSACLSGHEAWVRNVSFSQSGDQIVSASIDGWVRAWDAASGREIIRSRGAGLWALTAGREGLPPEPKDEVVPMWNVTGFEWLRMPDSAIETMPLRVGGGAVTEAALPMRALAWFPAILTDTTICTPRRPLVGTSAEHLFIIVLEGASTKT